MDQYRVVREIGKGGYGRALLVKSVATGELKVVKEMNLAGLSSDGIKSALKEVEILSSLKHTNIIRYRNCSQTKKKLFILMDYADGGDLAKQITQQRGRPMPEDTILDFFVQICLALKYLHDRKIMHRDLKPHNVFLAQGGIVKLGDFGIAKTLEHTCDMAKSAVGTPLYCSPEICMGKMYNTKSDIWSLGCILYEMMALKRPFTGLVLADIMRRIMLRQPSPPPSHYSKEMRDLVSKLLEKKPEHRPSINEILQLPLIRNKAVALLGKTLAKVELNHGVFHGFKPGQSPKEAGEICLALPTDKSPQRNGMAAGIYKDMKRMAQNLQQILHGENLVDVPEEVEKLNSGEFYFMGRKLFLKTVNEKDTVPFKIEAVRVFVEELIGVNRFREVYQAALACDNDEATFKMIEMTKSDIYVFQLIMQLVAYERISSTKIA